MGLDSVELVMAVEEEFGISISDAEASTIVTPKDLIRIVGEQLDLKEEDSERLTRDELRTRVRIVISKQLGISEFDDDDEFGRDLGVD